MDYTEQPDESTHPSSRPDGGASRQPKIDAGSRGSSERRSLSTTVQSITGYVTFKLAAVMFVWMSVAIWVVPSLFGVKIGSEQWVQLFVLDSESPLLMWTWLSSMFMHGGPTHLVVNAFMLVMFGSALEREMGRKHVLAVFFATGLSASAVQIGGVLALGETMKIVGASGGITGFIGVLTMLRPDSKVLLFFVIPMPLWLMTGLFVGTSIVAVSAYGVGAGGLANLAHLGGLIAGLAYGGLYDEDSLTRVRTSVRMSVSEIPRP